MNNTQHPTWTNPQSWIVSFQEISDETSLPRGVLAYEQDHGLGVEVRVVQRGRNEVMVVVCLLQGE